MASYKKHIRGTKLGQQNKTKKKSDGETALKIQQEGGTTEHYVLFMKKPWVCWVTLTTYLNSELFSLELEGQVLVVREFTRQTVQVRYLADM